MFGLSTFDSSLEMFDEVFSVSELGVSLSCDEFSVDELSADEKRRCTGDS